MTVTICKDRSNCYTQYVGTVKRDGEPPTTVVAPTLSDVFQMMEQCVLHEPKLYSQDCLPFELEL